MKPFAKFYQSREPSKQNILFNQLYWPQSSPMRLGAEGTHRPMGGVPLYRPRTMTDRYYEWTLPGAFKFLVVLHLTRVTSEKSCCQKIFRLYKKLYNV